MASPRLKIFHSPLANHFSAVMQSPQTVPAHSVRFI